jgi:HEAT repeat protein
LIPEPGDPVWQWFVFNGPHGQKFEWHRSHPRCSRDLDLLRQFIEERSAQIPDFTERARVVALHALALEDDVMVRTAIQVLCVVGTPEDLDLIVPLLRHRSRAVRSDAQACLFERGVRAGRRPTSR